MNTNEKIRKLIELSDIKKEYLYDMVDYIKKEIGFMQSETNQLSHEIINEKFKVQDMILKLDIEFIDTLDSLKFEEGISSIIELDKNTYPSLFDLKMVVDEISSFESDIATLQVKLNQVKLVKIGNVKTLKSTITLTSASLAYKKNKI